MHLASSGRVIIQLSEKVPEGQILCDKKGTKVAKVVEMIGPIDEPLASATPLTNSIKKYSGQNVYALTSSPSKTQRRRR